MDNDIVWCRFLYYLADQAAEVHWGPIEAEIRRHVFSSGSAELIDCERGLFPAIRPGQIVMTPSVSLRKQLPLYIDYIGSTLSETPDIYGYTSHAPSGQQATPQWGAVLNGLELIGGSECFYKLVTGLGRAELVRMAAETRNVVSVLDVRSVGELETLIGKVCIHSTQVSIQRFLNSVRNLLSLLLSSKAPEVRITMRS